MKKNSSDKDFKNKEKLIEVALEEFSTHSFRETSLNNIIKKAGVSKGSFYFHFRDKKALYFYLFDEIGKLKKEFISGQMSGNFYDGAQSDFFEILRKSALAGINFANSYPAYNKLALRFYREKGSRIYNEIKKRYLVDFESIIGPLIKKAMQEGQFRENFDSDFLTSLFLNFDAMFPYEKMESLEEIIKLLDKFIDFLKFGLANPKKVMESEGKNND